MLNNIIWWVTTILICPSTKVWIWILKLVVFSSSRTILADPSHLVDQQHQHLETKILGKWCQHYKMYRLRAYIFFFWSLMVYIRFLLREDGNRCHGHDVLAVSVCASQALTFEPLTDFHETQYQCYAIYGQPNAIHFDSLYSTTMWKTKVVRWET
jgi:hypothetical protein